MAEETFNQLYSRYNTDSVFNRVVIIGLLYLLNHELEYDQIWDDNVVEKVVVPFMYDFGSSDERFAQDNYTFFGNTCFSEKKINGKFDMLPRGALKYTGSNIDSGNITNRFVKGNYLKNENGKLTSYQSFLYSIPLTFNFECEMWIDNIVTAFKIEQGLREAFYKNKTFNVLFRGMKIACTAGFPESHTLDKTVQYAFDAERNIKLTFSLAVETYQPVFDKTVAIEANKRIEKIGYDIEMPHGTTQRLYDLKFKHFDTSVVYPVGTQILIEWDSKSNVSDMCTIGVSYIKDGVEQLIDVIPYNQRSYYLTLPESISNFEQPEIIFNDQELVIKQPTVKIVPDENNKITEHSFIILDPGSFAVDSGQLPVTIEYTKDDGTVELSTSYYFNIKQRQIDVNCPIDIDGNPMSYNKDYTINNISLKIFYPLDKTICDQIDNLLVI